MSICLSQHVTIVNFSWKSARKHWNTCAVFNVPCVFRQSFYMFLIIFRYIYIYICVCVCMYVYIYIILYIYMCVCVHVRIYTHTHIYIYSYYYYIKYVYIYIVITYDVYHVSLPPNNWPFPPFSPRPPAASFVQSLDLRHREGREMRAVDVLFGNGAAERHHLRGRPTVKIHGEALAWFNILWLLYG